MAKKKRANPEIEQIKTELMSLKIRQRRLEEFLLNFPNVDDYIRSWTSDIGDDELFNETVKIVRKYDRASASLLQRRLMIGYARAAHLIDQMEEKGIIGSANGAEPRKVFKAKK